MSELSLEQFNSDKKIQREIELAERTNEGINIKEKIEIVRKTKDMLYDLLYEVNKKDNFL